MPRPGPALRTAPAVVGSATRRTTSRSDPRIRYRVVVLALLMAALSACDGNAAPTTPPALASTATTPASPAAAAPTTTTASSSSSSASGCTLLTNSDVATALGEPVVANNNLGCEVASVAQHPFKFVRFISSTTSAGGFEADARMIAGENGGANTIVPVAGIGDVAFAWHDDLGNARLDVRKGTRAVEINFSLGVLGTGDLATKAKIATQLATIAAGRLT